MTDIEPHEEVLRGEAAPKMAANAEGPDPSNTPIEELVAPLDDDEAGLDRLSALWANPDVAEDQVRESIQQATATPDSSPQPESGQ